MGLWTIRLAKPGDKPKVFRDGSPLKKSDGQRYGTVVNVSSSFQAGSNKLFVKVRLKDLSFPLTIIPILVRLILHDYCLGRFREIVGWKFFPSLSSKYHHNLFISVSNDRKVSV